MNHSTRLSFVLRRFRPAFFHPLSIALIALAFSVWRLPAAVSVVSYWRMGESDASVIPGIASTTVDFVGGNTLSLSSAPFYQQTVSAEASTHCGSLSSVWFFTGTYGTAAIFNLQNNFGIECWVNPNSVSGTQCLVYNGNTSSSGFGIYISGGSYAGLFGGKSFIGSGTATAGQWTHVALVCNAGVAQLYVNGAPAGSSYSNTPNPATGSFGVAANPGNHALEQTFSYIDELRVFSFAPGQFSTNDLLVFAPLPSPITTTLAATALADTSATLNGTVNPNGYSTGAWFEYGTSAAYGQTTAVTNVGAGVAAGSASFGVTGLQSGVIYHYRVVASNAFAMSQGDDVIFRKPQTNYVTSVEDNGPDTLRDAISNSVANDTVLITTNGLIDISGSEIFIDKNLTIVGGSGTNMIRKRFMTDRLFEIGAGVHVVMNGLHLTSGTATNSSLSFFPAGNGGAIFNSGVLELYQCWIENSKAGNGAESFFSAGGTGGSGGGIFNAPGSSLTASNCCFSGNHAGDGGTGTFPGGGAAGSGGAIANLGTMQLRSCTFAQNSGGRGGDSFGSGVRAGSGGHGGAIISYSSLAATACTFSGNTSGNAGNGIISGAGGAAGSGGGICNAGGLVQLRNDIVAQNGLGSPGTGSGAVAGAGVDLFGSFSSTGYNLIGITDSATITNILTGNLAGNLCTPLNALLGTLADNGGPTRSIQPLSTNSPAFEAGDDALYPSMLVDQRGFPRLSCDHVDIGAVEYRPPPALTILGANPATNLLNQVYTDAGAQAASGCPGGGSSLPVITTGFVNTNLLGTYTLTYTATDPYGIASTNTRTVLIVALPNVLSASTSIVSTNQPQGTLNVLFSGTFNGGYLPGSAWFVWGLNFSNSATVGQIAFSPGVSTVPISAVVSNLIPGIRYYWWLSVSNQLGVSTSFDQIFSSPPIYPVGDTDGDGVVNQTEFNTVYSNYLFNSHGFLMTNVAGLGSNQVSFELTNIPGLTVESSTDLVNWYSIGPTRPGYHFADTNAPGAPQLFYRLRYP
jgi:hypothetical protein